MCASPSYCMSSRHLGDRIRSRYSRFHIRRKHSESSGYSRKLDKWRDNMYQSGILRCLTGNRRDNRFAQKPARGPARELTTPARRMNLGYAV